MTGYSKITYTSSHDKNTFLKELKVIEKYQLERTSGFYLVLLKVQFLRLETAFFIPQE